MFIVQQILPYTESKRVDSTAIWNENIYFGHRLLKGNDIATLCTKSSSMSGIV